MVLYKCPNCLRIVDLPEGNYFCSICGPDTQMRKLRLFPSEYEMVSDVFRRYPDLLEYYNTVVMPEQPVTEKARLWVTAVEAYKRWQAITPEEARVMSKLVYA